MTGTRTTNLNNRANVVDELLGNRDGSTTIIEFAKFATQLAGAGAVRELIDRIQKALEADLADLSDLVAGGAKLNLVDPVAFQTSSPGAFATAFAAGTVHNGHAAVLNERFFMNDRGVENGLYTVTAGAPVRTSDANEASELPLLTFLDNMSGNSYTCITPAPITIGTTVLTFKQAGKGASILPSVSAGQSITDPSNARVVLLNEAGDGLQLVRYADLFKKISGEIMPTEYTFSGADNVGTVPKTILFPDAKQTRMTVYNLSTTGKIAIAAGDAVPSIGNVGITIGPGIAAPLDPLPLGKVNAIADQANIPIYIVYSNLSGVDPNAAAAADVHLARYGGTLTAAMRSEIKKVYMALDAAGWFRRGRFALYTAPNSSDSLLKWAMPGSYTRIGQPTGSWAGMSLNGIGDAIDLGERLTAIAGINDHTVLHYTDDTIQGSAHYAGGDSAVRNGPNRTSVSSTMHSLSSAQIVTVGGVGGLQGLTRTGPGKFTIHRDKGSAHFEQEVAVTDTSASTSNFVDGAINGTSGLSAFYTGYLKARYVGLNLSKDQRYAGAAALDAFFAAAAGF